jgi:hypothetical protein
VEKDSPAMALMLAGADGKSSAVVQYTALLLKTTKYVKYVLIFKKILFCSSNKILLRNTVVGFLASVRK